MFSKNIPLDSPNIMQWGRVPWSWKKYGCTEVPGRTEVFMKYVWKITGKDLQWSRTSRLKMTSLIVFYLKFYNFQSSCFIEYLRLNISVFLISIKVLLTLFQKVTTINQLSWGCQYSQVNKDCSTDGVNFGLTSFGNDWKWSQGNFDCMLFSCHIRVW